MKNLILNKLIKIMPAFKQSGYHLYMNKFKDLKKLDLRKDFLDEGVDKAMTNYADNGFTQPHSWYRSRLKEYNFYGFQNVADLGCGYGRFSFYLAEENSKVVGIDLSEGLINIANNLNKKFNFKNIEFEVGDITNTSLPSSSFDAVFLQSVTYKLPRQPLFTEVRRIIKPGGAVFVGELNSKGKMIWRICTGYKRGGFKNNLYKDAVSAIKNGPFYDGSRNYATKDTLDEIMQAYGFKIDNKYPVKDMTSEVDSPINIEILNDLDLFLSKFNEDEKFRNIAIEHTSTLIKAVENSLFFRMVAA